MIGQNNNIMKDINLALLWAQDYRHQRRLCLVIDLEYNIEIEWWYVDGDGQFWPKGIYDGDER